MKTVRWAILLGIVFLLAGCINPYKIDQRNARLLKNDKKVFVLLHVDNPDLNSQYVFMRSDWQSGMVIAIGDFESGGGLFAYRPYYISEALAEDEWIGAFLDPGDHYLGMVRYLTQTKDFTNEVSANPGWKIRIYPGDRYVFGGSIEIVQKSITVGKKSVKYWEPGGAGPGDLDKAHEILREIIPGAPVPVMRQVEVYSGKPMKYHVPLPVRSGNPPED